MTTVAVIGCTHAGTFSASSILQHHPDWEVHVFERNDSLSFLSCGIALWVGNHVSDPNKMFYSSPEALSEAGAHMHMKHDVLDVDIKAGVLHAQDMTTKETTEYTFDKLVITTGSAAVTPPIDGLDEGLENGKILLCKNWDHAKAIKEKVEHVKSAIVIGAGYIGAELAEQLSTIGVKATLVDALDHVLANNVDEKISEIVEKDFVDHDVELALGQFVESFSFSDDSVTVKTSSSEYTADIAIMAAGFRPRTDLFTDQVTMIDNGAIVVDSYMHASDKEGNILDNVFAAGDSATVHFNPTDKEDYIPLATNAVRQGLLVGANIESPTAQYMGTQSTSAVQLYDLALAATGLTLNGAKKREIDAQSTTIEQDYRPDFMLTTTPVTATLVWEKSSHKILGAQFACRHDITQAANVVSVSIQAGFTIEQLAGVDLFFQPNFTQPVNFVGAVAMQAVAEA